MGGTLKENKKTGDYLWSIFELMLFSQSGFVFIYLKIVYKTKNLSKNFFKTKFLLKFTVSCFV